MCNRKIVAVSCVVSVVSTVIACSQCTQRGPRGCFGQRGQCGNVDNVVSADSVVSANSLVRVVNICLENACRIADHDWNYFCLNQAFRLSFRCLAGFCIYEYYVRRFSFRNNVL